MNWDQIETDWIAMTQRMRPDWQSTPPAGAESKPRAGSKLATPETEPAVLVREVA